MADGFVQVAPDSTGKKIDNTELTVGANTVERQRVNIADPTSATAIAGVTAGGALKTDASATTQPISAGSLPLPTGAALDTTVAGVTTAIGLQAKLTDTQPISVASLPLPTGAALDSSLTTIATDISLQAKLTDTQPVSIAVPVAVTGAFFQVVQPVSGVVDLTGMSLMAVSTFQRARGFEILHPRHGRLGRRRHA
jgi:hypothetical protein